MDSERQGAPLVLPPALLAEVEEAAREERRLAGDVVRDALERYLRQPRQRAAATQSGGLTAAEAVERLLEERKGTVLPEGVTIRELMTYGRA
jgi:metal-responsive CopG/Arc/MetJ family transcriptional regulator